MPSFKYGKIRDEYIISRLGKGIWCFNLLSIPILREIVKHMLSMWCFQESLLSTVRPRNLIWETFSRGVPSKIMSEGNVSRVLLKSMYFVFWRLRDNLLARIHWVTFESSKFIVRMRVCGSLWEKNKFESSAKSMNVRTSDDLQKSLMYTKNKSGPRRLPWGTPQWMLCRLELWAFKNTNCFLLVRYISWTTPRPFLVFHNGMIYRVRFHG